MASTGTFSPYYSLNTVGTSSWIETVKILPGTPADNVPTIWIANMVQCDRNMRWSTHELAEHIYEHSNDPAVPFSFTGLCCLDDDTAESVYSSIDESTDELTLQPTTCPTSKSHPSEAITESIQIEIVSFFADSRHNSKTLNTSNSLGHESTSKGLHAVTERHKKDPVNNPENDHEDTHMIDSPASDSTSDFSDEICDLGSPSNLKWTSRHDSDRKANLKWTLSKIVCISCMHAYFHGSRTAKLSCGHHMCYICLERLFTLSVQDTRHMPPRCRSDEIAFHHVEFLFDAEFTKM
ncbi:hypothetical protein B0J11DRAFT_45393 [Dendryphion nanum]|uniref:RING-type domain-containing protein n=1 Tax=Dendryphion nanum TaxID=256645 RepID=A0A9P9ELA0_9PLEO|nr:hypothetical protein B0J11DRAFT_45393 [Dendryphion nanum]